MNYVDKLLTNKVAMVVIYIVFALAASIQSFLPKPHSYIEDGKQYFCTQYNNYVIFKSSFNHLVQGKDLYRLYLEEHDDFYKYSPTAALFFGLFVGFPDAIGLSLWNILNALMILAGVYYLPALSLKSKGLILLGTLIETMTCMQNEQSNALVGGLIILAFGLLERRNYFLAVFCIVFSAYIKVFSIAALALFIFYPGKWKLTLYTVFWSVVLFLLPLTVVNFAQLRFLYASWGGLLAKDHSIYVGLCVSR